MFDENENDALVPEGEVADRLRAGMGQAALSAIEVVDEEYAALAVEFAGQAMDFVEAMRSRDVSASDIRMHTLGIVLQAVEVAYAPAEGVS